MPRWASSSPTPRATSAWLGSWPFDEPRSVEAVRVRGGHCPGCGDPLHRTASGHGIEIDACARCGGIWLDAGELEHLTTGLDPAPGTGAANESVLRNQVPPPRSREPDVRYRDCPRCQQVMT